MSMRIPAIVAGPLRRALSGEVVEWPQLDAAATRHAIAALDAHGVLPLVHEVARTGALTGVPPDLAAALGAAYAATAARNVLWLREIDRLLATCADAGVSPVLTKGAALLYAVYPNVALRPLGDVDLLVAEADLDPVDAALAANGYRLLADDAERWRHHRTFTRRTPSGVRYTVDVHRRLLASPPYDRLVPADAVIARSRSLPRDGASVRIPAPVDLMLHLAAHLVLQHPRAERLVWVADIDRVARAWFADEVGWDDLVQRARASWLVQALADAVELARTWFATPLPAAGRALLIGTGPTREEAVVYDRLRRRAPVGREGARLLADVRGIRGWRARAAFVWAHAMPAPREMRRWYGLDRSRRVPIYYARRLLHGVRDISVHLATHRRSGPSEPPESWMIEP